MTFTIHSNCMMYRQKDQQRVYTLRFYCTTYSQVRKVKQTASTKHKNIIYMNLINKLSLTGLYWSSPVRLSLG